MNIGTLIRDLRKINIIAPGPRSILDADRLPSKSDGTNLGLKVGSEWYWPNAYRNGMGHREFLHAFDGDNSIWVPEFQMVTLKSFLTAIGQENTDTEVHPLRNYTLPGAIVRAGDLVKMETTWSMPNTGTACYPKIRCGGSTIGGTTIVGRQGLEQSATIKIRDLTTGQVGSVNNVDGGYGSYNGTPSYITKDFTGDLDLVFAAQWSAAGGGLTLTLETAHIFLFRGTENYAS